MRNNGWWSSTGFVWKSHPARCDAKKHLAAPHSLSSTSLFHLSSSFVVQRTSFSSLSLLQPIPQDYLHRTMSATKQVRSRAQPHAVLIGNTSPHSPNRRAYVVQVKGEEIGSSRYLERKCSRSPLGSVSLLSFANVLLLTCLIFAGNILP